MPAPAIPLHRPSVGATGSATRSSPDELPTLSPSADLADEDVDRVLESARSVGRA